MSMRFENTSVMRSSNGTPSTPIEEKPLPPPPYIEPWATKALPIPFSPPSTNPPRPKKKVPWKGKNILVLLPWDNERGQRGGPPKPMTQKDVAAMLKDWEQLGYDTSGFNLGSDGGEIDDGEGGPGQSRIGWPLEIDMKMERDQEAGEFKVNIPDKREWDAYVEELKEAKLRALGVSLGDDDPAPIISPAISNLNLSRRTSMQYPPLPFSPPIPTSSAASSHIPHNSNLPFSPALIGGNGLSTSQSSNQGSIASPSSMHAHLHGKLGMRHNSVSFGPSGDHPFGSPFQYPQHPSPRVWSPQQMLYQHGHRVGSPSMHNLGSIISPARVGSPLSNDGFFPGEVSQRQVVLQNQLMAANGGSIPIPRVSPRLQEVRESEDEHLHEIPSSKSPSKTPEARQIIKHNSSASLQKEIDDAEYHLEEQFQRQLDGDDYSPHSDHGEMDKQFKEKAIPHVRNTSIINGGLGSARFPLDDSEDDLDHGPGPVLHHPQPHSRGHSLSQRPFQDVEDTSSGESKSGPNGGKDLGKYDLSDIETNPSNLGTPTLQNNLPGFGHDRNISVASNPWIDSESIGGHQKKINQSIPNHRVKQSISGLNVTAKPFKFDPSSSFQPSQFSFTGGNTFQPINNTVNMNYSQFPHSHAQPHPHNGPFGPTNHSNPGNHSLENSFGKVIAAAPIFAPSNGPPSFVPNQSDFNFTGPNFRPDAPTFTPLVPTFSNPTNSTFGNESQKIFGGIDLNALEVNKSTKKSKAIPIIRPDIDQVKDIEDNTMEGKDGRITQGEGRIKRMRGSINDGESIPLFAEPSLPLQEISPQPHRKEAQLTVPPQLIPSQTDKENAIPLVESEDEMTTDVDVDVDGRSEQNENEFVPYEFQQQKQAEDFNAARPFSGTYEFGNSAYGVDDYQDDEVEPEVEPETQTNQSHSKTKSNESGSHSGHRKSSSSLSATARPFEFKTGSNFAFNFSANKVPKLSAIPPTLPKSGLSSSKYARRSPTPPQDESPMLQLDERNDFQNSLPGPQSPPKYEDDVVSSELEEGEIREPTFEEIDAVMRELNSTEMSPVSQDGGLGWNQSPKRNAQVPVLNSSPVRFQPNNILRSDAPSPSPRRYNGLSMGNSPNRIYSRDQDDPFADDDQITSAMALESPIIHRLNTGNSLPASDWDDVLSEGEEIKLQERIGFFNGHINEMVGGLLSDRLNPMEQQLKSIQMSLQLLSHSQVAKPTSERRERERRSLSGALSDADDEDDEDPIRSMSPRRNTKLDKIRTVVLDALNTHSSRPQTAITPLATTSTLSAPDSRMILQTLEELKDQFNQSMKVDPRSDYLRSMIEEIIEKKLPAHTLASASVSEDSQVDDDLAYKLAEAEEKILALEERSKLQSEVTEEKSKLQTEETQLQLEEMEQRSQSKISELEAKLARADEWVEEEIRKRRLAEDSKAITERLMANTLDQENRFRQIIDEKSTKVENEIQNRRKAEDRLAEVQRLLRIASEEEDRLRDLLLEKDSKIREIAEHSDQKVRMFEESRGKFTMRIAHLEATQETFRKTEEDLTATVHMAESELRESRSLAHRWQLEAESATEAAKRHSDDAEQSNETNKDLRRTIETLKSQMEESIRVRESMRSKLMDLQEDMARAAHDISQENSHRLKKEQELLARQEVLDAKLQAEARTRERLEMEIERLESGERQGIRAVNECKRLETLINDLRTQNEELRTDNDTAKRDVRRYQREFEEARESGLAEVQRTRKYMQVEVDSANNQVNVVREELENQILGLRNTIDLIKIDGETAKERHEMLLEEIEASKQKLADELMRKHRDEIDDIQTHHREQLRNSIEDSQRSEQHLLERLSLSTMKTEHLQDVVSHLEERLEISKDAAKAAIEAAKGARSGNGSQSTASISELESRNPSRTTEPGKISPQALRESIMVLQEQLQDRELKIEALEQQLSMADPESSTKISKRDDEIVWLRELLAVRKSDLQDIVNTLSGSGSFDVESLRDAAIRLNANIQMEEQERERAINGGSSVINLPNIAASIAASPRVAQAVGPLAAAWGSWTRKSRDREQSLSSSVANNSVQKKIGKNENVASTPSKASGSTPGFLTGLMTPPASNMRGVPTPGAPGPLQVKREPSTFIRDNALSAFNSTGARFSNTGAGGNQLLGRQGGGANGNGMGIGISTPRRADKVPGILRREKDVPSTPPMMRSSSYDSDAVPRGDELHSAGGGAGTMGMGVGVNPLGMSLGEELGDFGSEAGFYDDDESTVDEMAGIYSGGFGR